jgi:hypothetical protein
MRRNYFERLSFKQNTSNRSRNLLEENESEFISLFLVVVSFLQK